MDKIDQNAIDAQMKKNLEDAQKQLDQIMFQSYVAAGKIFS